MAIYLNSQMCEELQLPFSGSSGDIYCLSIEHVRNVFMKWDEEMPTLIVPREEPIFPRKKKRRKAGPVDLQLKHTDHSGWFEIVGE